MTTTSDNSYSMALPADHIPGPQQGYWTFEEYVALPDEGKRYEIMNGVLIMAPSPEADHQSAVLRLGYFYGCMNWLVKLCYRNLKKV